jgi:CheY-like chemotaxis protein
LSPFLGQGVGLHLCKVLASLLGADIWLDESYDSGYPGRPGARFVVSLRQAPNQHDDDKADRAGSEGDTVETQLSSSDDDGGDPTTTTTKEIPEALSVLFVDDDLVLRKLFCRTIRTALPGWTVREAANGETAIRLVEASRSRSGGDGSPYDLIFVDQYMASYDKQLLGTETVTALRSMGVACRICGLSANDAEREFLAAGADAFMFKPFPCERRALLGELSRILSAGHEARIRMVDS